MNEATAVMRPTSIAALASIEPAASCKCVLDGLIRHSKRCERKEQRAPIKLISLAITPDIIERFWSKVKKTESCWSWIGSRDVGEYGAFSVGKHVQYKAHRVAWYLVSGVDPGNLFVLHHCDSPWCVRPDHLFLGTNRDNMEDMARKGRSKKGRPGTRGQASGMAKLTEDQVRAIRTDRRTLTEVAKDYGICFQTVSLIRLRKNWGWLQ